MPTRISPPAWARKAVRGGRLGTRFVESVPFGKSLAIHRFELKNGLNVLVMPDHSAPVVAYQTWFRVGSRHERPGKTGLAHLFEHLMFKATESRPAGEFDRTLEALGADTNASTWTDWTQYHENVPKRAFPKVVALESDRMAHLVLSKEQVASEKEVVQNERRWRVDDDVDGTVSEVLYKTAFTKHPYRWPTIGWMKDIEGFTVRDCLNFYRTFYAPNNATVVVVGDVKGPDVLAELEAAYGAYPKARIPKERKVKEPRQVRERRVSLRLSTPTERVTVGVHAAPYASFDFAAMTLAHEILLGGRASRLYQRFIVEDRSATDVGGFLAPFRDPGLWEITLNARPGKRAKDLEATLYEELERVAAEGVTGEELERAKNRLELSFLGGMETAAGKAEQIGFYETLTGKPNHAFTRLAELLRVQSKDVARVVRAFDRPNRNVVTVLPKAKRPAKATRARATKRRAAKRGARA